MKHLAVRQKYSAVHCIFNSLLSVSSGDETLHLMLDRLLPNSANAYCLWVNTSGRSRPLVKGGGPGHPHPEIRGVASKKIFSALWASFFSATPSYDFCTELNEIKTEIFAKVAPQ